MTGWWRGGTRTPMRTVVSGSFVLLLAGSAGDTLTGAAAPKTYRFHPKYRTPPSLESVQNGN
jgi:hypothetical protein